MPPTGTHPLIRVLMISKACVVGAYQRKLEEIAANPDIKLTVIVPPSWRDPSGSTTFLERAHVNGYDLLADPILFNGNFHLHVYPGLGRRMAQIKPDVVHIDEEPYNLATLQAMRLALKHGARPLFFTWQNLNRSYPFPFNWIERYNLARALYGIAGNHEAMTVWRAKGYRGPMKVIPQFGVDPDIFKPKRTAQDGDERGWALGCVARLTSDKGVDVLLRAAAQLPGMWRLYVLGEGPERSALQGLARELGLEDRVLFEKPISSTQMPHYLADLDALVLPSRTAPNWKEQFGRVLVEAMACGVPVIGSTCGEIPQVIGDAGLVFPEDDAEALRATLIRLMREDGLRQTLAARGRARVLDHYTHKQIAAETVEIYREMMQGRAGSGCDGFEVQPPHPANTG